MALLRAHLADKFPPFVYRDGVFEWLGETVFDESEIVLTLHYEIEQGRLFKFTAW